MMTETPQFSYKAMYITPFTQLRRTDVDGRESYVPIERNFQPTGIRLLDGFAEQLVAGNSSRAAYCKRMGITTTQLSALFLLLTGANADTFRRYFCLRLADDLLRYTDMDIPAVALRSGFGTSVNLFLACRKAHNCPPTDRRLMLRKKGDLGRYKL